MSDNKNNESELKLPSNEKYMERLNELRRDYEEHINIVEDYLNKSTVSQDVAGAITDEGKKPSSLDNKEATSSVVAIANEQKESNAIDAVTDRTSDIRRSARVPKKRKLYSEEEYLHHKGTTDKRRKSD